MNLMWIHKVIVSLILCLSLSTMVMLFSCDNNGSLSTPPFFPILKAPEPFRLEALAQGKLSLKDNCLRLTPVLLPGDGLLLIWPYGYTLKIEGSDVSIVDDSGLVVAKVGEKIKVGGGEITLERAEQYLGVSLSEKHPGPYWRVSEVIKD
jgi:hypothetical protein